MKAAVFYGIRDVRLEEIDVPEIKDDEVLVKVRVALTCGTDKKMYLRGYHLAKPPFVFGHEFAGDIVKVGKKVKGFYEGQRVVAANSAPCNYCYFCKIGKKSVCENLFIRVSGAFAEYVDVPSPIVKQNLFPIPDHVSYKEAALLEPLACVVHGIEESGIKLGDTVVINGAGPIGLMFVRLAKLKGARVIVTGSGRERLDAAKKLGADEIIDIHQVEDQVEAVRELTEDKRGVDVGIEAVGRPEVWEKTIKMVRKGGTVNLFGGCASGTKINLDTHLIHYSQLTLKGVFHHTPEHVKRALTIISQKEINAECIVKDEVKLSDFSRVLGMMVEKKGIKIAVVP
ncbi:zinc-binding dehydrogenase [Candidatus Aerophobetes bacterium]|nr:zinc-binding dehydrogenase [Candidatus Aerophobetes bacterium]